MKMLCNKCKEMFPINEIELYSNGEFIIGFCKVCEPKGRRRMNNSELINFIEDEIEVLKDYKYGYNSASRRIKFLESKIKELRKTAINRNQEEPKSEVEE